VCAARTSPADPWPDAALYAPASLRLLPTDDDSLAAALPPTAPKAWVHHRSTALAGCAFALEAAVAAASPTLPAALTSAGGVIVAVGAAAPGGMRLVRNTPILFDDNRHKAIDPKPVYPFRASATSKTHDSGRAVVEGGGGVQAHADGWGDARRLHAHTHTRVHTHTHPQPPLT